jgi:hypothetical protein
MKNFKEMRKKGMPPGEHVFDTKINRVHLMVHKEKGKFVTYVDKEKLDTYPNLAMAKKAGQEFIKALRK